MVAMVAISFSNSCVATRAAGRLFNRDRGRLREVLMVGMRSDRTRARARDVLETRYPVPEDADRLRELAIDYVREAERLEQSKGRPVQSDELLSSALDAIARDYFARAVGRAVSHRKR
jgi:hypothetical protein